MVRKRIKTIPILYDTKDYFSSEAHFVSLCPFPNNTFVASHLPSADIYYHEKAQSAIGPAMWTFGATSGVNVWSVDGQSLLKTHSPSDLPMCGPAEGGDGSDVCSFFAYQSDGHQYVWAGAFAPDRVDVFDIDTAEYVSYMPTCSTPLDLDYVPNRQEMWLHCAGTNEGSDGHIDVFSTNSLATNYDLVNLNVTGRSYGRQVMDSSLGVYGYATVYNQPFLYKIDLATRQVAKRIPLELSNGAYELAYSPLNQHLFIRSRVTCTCGDETKDIADCGRFGGGLVDVVTGPSAGQTQVEGTSGSSCVGSAADTIGVYEYDTKTDRIVGTHNILEGTGQGATPMASPRGDYVLLVGNDGGQNIRVYEPKLNAAVSVGINAEEHYHAPSGTNAICCTSQLPLIPFPLLHNIVTVGRHSGPIPRRPSGAASHY